MKRSILAFAAGEIGAQALKILMAQNANIVAIVISEDDPEMQNDAIFKISKHPVYFYKSQYREVCALIRDNSIDLAILAWWPHILKHDLLMLPRMGTLNFHPSYLPYGRGKHPYFWCFADESPFGVTIHWVDQHIDNGYIAFQQEILINTTDTAGTIYQKARKTIVDLFQDNISIIISGNIPKISMDGLNFPLRYSREIEPNSRINLEKNYQAKHLLNLIRGRSGFGQGGCWFEENGEWYEVDITIRSKNRPEIKQ
ncbi:MAG: formyltransferase family protein [Gammaproteobacteria bacterium]|nr:formyltransferase family protein [Gammaproteobacteria bacterium]